MDQWSFILLDHLNSDDDMIAESCFFMVQLHVDIVVDANTVQSTWRCHEWM